VQQAIPPEAALVEIIKYQPFAPVAQAAASPFGPTRYVAYVLHREGPPTWVDLGEAAPIDEAIQTLQRTLSHAPQVATKTTNAFIAWITGVIHRFQGHSRLTDVQKHARQLDEQVMRPIRPLLGQSRLILLSPDSALNLIPFSVLVDEQHRFLVKRFTFAYLTTGRELLRLQTKSPHRHGPLIIADPNFGPRCAGTERTSFSFEQLPGAAEEGQQIRRLLPMARFLSGDEATEAALKRVQGPWLLHVATHAFFSAAQSAASPQAVTDPHCEPVPPPQVQTVVQPNPLLRSGLALAGANRRQSGPEDGILTALEATLELDLWGTQLIVLSACETGVGDVSNGEGVYGLRRALVMAGAETQVMSLWQVEDKATRDLMVEYYHRLLTNGAGRIEALREVQLAMLKGKQWQEPFYWASFIASGAWTPLEK
jgi:CHAT domain-containing protein